jgi:Cu/Ag efflux pump CusA
MRERVAPAFASTVTIAAVYLPFAIAGEVAGNEIAAPMAAVVLGGLVTTAVLNVLVLPAMYLRFAGTEGTAPGRPWRPERLDPRQRLSTISRRGRHAAE